MMAPVNSPAAPCGRFLSPLRRGAARLFVSAALLSAFALPAFAGIIHGHVRNGTTGRTVPHAEVVLISLVSGMEQLTSVKSDAEGAFSFDRPEIGTGPMLVRATYESADYFQMCPPGRDTAEIEVFEANAPASAVRVTSRAIIFQPNGARLMVGEEFMIQNSTQPPATYNNPKGAFEFELPAGAKIQQVTATPPGGMPLPQGTSDKGKGRYAVDFPLKPGETNFRIAYDLPYEGAQASIRAAGLLPADRVLLAVPPGVKISSEGFAPAGTEQGYSILARENVAAGTPLAITLSGSAPPPPPEQGAAAQGGMGPGGPGQGGRDAGAPAGENLSLMPPRLASFQWIVLGGMGLFFLLGFIFLMRRPVAAGEMAAAGQSVASAATAAEPVSGSRAKKQRAAASAALAPYPPASASAPAAATAHPVLEEAEQGARMNLEELKDTLFRLELRRQAGTITEEDYARERGRLDAVLRGIVRG